MWLIVNMLTISITKAFIFAIGTKKGHIKPWICSVGKRQQ